MFSLCSRHQWWLRRSLSLNLELPVTLFWGNYLETGLNQDDKTLLSSTKAHNTRNPLVKPLPGNSKSFLLRVYSFQAKKKKENDRVERPSPKRGVEVCCKSPSPLSWHVWHRPLRHLTECRFFLTANCCGKIHLSPLIYHVIKMNIII